MRFGYNTASHSLESTLSMPISIARCGFMLGVAAVLAACGGAVGDARIGGRNPPATVAPAGVYLGYYQEDTTSDTSPDATAGALVLNLPATSGAAITGNMDYHFAACQALNAVPLAGTRSDLAVNAGTFTGTVDATTQAGTFTAQFDTTNLYFTGNYTNTGGKQTVSPAGCTPYTVAALGTIGLFPIDANVPKDTFDVTYTTATRTIAWSSITGLSKALVYIVDPAIVSAGGASPVLWQVWLDPALSAVVPAGITLTSGHTYAAAVELADGARTRIAFGSQSFMAP